MNVQWKLTNAE